MTTRLGGLPAPDVSPDDAGPWSVVSPVRHAQATASQARARRLKEPPFGLVTQVPPRVGITLAGLDDTSGVAGAGAVRVTAAARGAALALSFDDDGGAVRGIASHARRTWLLPGLVSQPEERDGTDPSQGLPEPVDVADLDGSLAGAIRSRDGAFAAVSVRDGRMPAVAIVRLEPRELVRWVVGARCAAWNADGTQIAIGGDWGVILAEGLKGA